MRKANGIEAATNLRTRRRLIDTIFRKYCASINACLLFPLFQNNDDSDRRFHYNSGSPICEPLLMLARGESMARPLKIDSAQFGAKAGRHMLEFGRDPRNSAHRQWLLNHIQRIYAPFTDTGRHLFGPARSPARRTCTRRGLVLC